MNPYNWDNLNVGRFDLNHSENFFAFKHSKHEKFGLGTNIESMIDLDDVKENCSGVLNEQPSQDPLDCKKSKVIEHKEKHQKVLIKQNSKSPENAPKPITNILQQPFKAPANTPHSGKEKVPNVLKYAEIYEKKKQCIIEKQIEEDRKKRIFHSRPVPNFNTVLRKKDIKVITVPTTPKVLKNSAKAMERLKKIEELRKKSPPKHHAKEAKVLHEEPFVPKLESRALDTHPFNLHIERRLCVRKHFNEKIQKHMEEKKRKEEEERHKRDEELSREFRKMTTFKARPNPFKQYH